MGCMPTQDTRVGLMNGQGDSKLENSGHLGEQGPQLREGIRALWRQKSFTLEGERDLVDVTWGT